MTTHFSSDPNTFDINAVEFARSLQVAAEGHALWDPSAIDEYGGVEGDCGYFEGGRFQALFSVYDPPNGLGLVAIAPPQGRDKFMREICNQNDIIRSSDSLSVNVEADLQLPPLPQLPALTIAISGGRSQEEERSAFLAFGGSKRTIHADRRIRGFENYLLEHGDTIMAHYGEEYPVTIDNLVIVYQSTRCISWWSGISYRRSTSSHGQIGAEIAGVGGSAHVAVVRSHDRPWLSNRGPESWDNQTQPGYSIVLRTVAMKKRSRRTRLWRSIRTLAGHKADGDRPNTGPKQQLSPAGPVNRTSDAVTPPHPPGTSRSKDVSMVDSTANDNSESSSPVEDEDSATELIAAQQDLLDQALNDALLENPEIDVVVGNWDVVLGSGLRTLSHKIHIERSGKRVVGRLTDARAESMLQTPNDDERAKHPSEAKTSHPRDKQKGGRRPKHVTRACDACRGRKYKCDGSQPICGACAQRNTECTWSLQADQRHGQTIVTKEQLADVNRRIAELEEDQRQSAHENAHLRHGNEFMKAICREYGLAIPGHTSPSLRIPSMFISSPATPADSLPNTSDSNQFQSPRQDLLGVDYDYRYRASGVRMRHKAAPSLPYPDVNPISFGKGLGVPGTGAGKVSMHIDANRSGFIAHTPSHLAPALRIRTANHTGRACDACRARKYKCDGSKPVCAPCVQRGTDCEWPAPVDNLKRRALTKKEPAGVNRRIAELEDQQRQTAQENARLKGENDALKDTLRENGIPLPELAAFGSAGASSSLQADFFPSPAGPTSSGAEQGHTQGMLRVDWRPRSGSTLYPAEQSAQNRARSESDPYLLDPYPNPAFVRKGRTIPGTGPGNLKSESGIFAHALRITTANDDDNGAFTKSGSMSSGYDTPSLVSDIPTDSSLLDSPKMPFLSAPASPCIHSHSPTTTPSIFDTPSSPVKNSMVFNHTPFKSEVDLHPSPFLPTFPGSSNSSPSLYDQHNFTFTSNTNDSMLLGMSGWLFGAEDRDEMKVEM